MQETIQDLMTRRSCRKFKANAVPRDLIEQVIQAGIYAPSGMGKQDTIVVAVTNKELRDRLATANAAVAGMPAGTDPFYGAPVVLVVLAKKNCSTHVYDGSGTLCNMLNAAHALGLGSCWIHRAKEEFEQPEFRHLLADLGVEGEYEGIGHCVLGYPAGSAAPAAPRKDGRVFWVE
jgi:nitroreductase